MSQSSENELKPQQADYTGSQPADNLLIPKESDEQPTLSVVLPTLNEEDGIEQCITNIKNAIEELQISAEIIISDSSEDRTPEIARSLGAEVLTPDEPGYGYAYRYAFERTRGEYIVMGDADTTYDFEAIPRLMRKMRDDNADIVLGSRLNGDIRPGSMPLLHRYIGNPLLTKFLNIFYGAGVSDAHSGFRLLTREAYEKLNLTTNGMEFASEMIMIAGQRNLKISEVPITYYEREGDATLDSFHDGWRHIKFMLVNAPGYLFSLPGILMGVLGLSLIIFVQMKIQVAGQWFGVNSMMLASLLVILGFQIGSFGLATSHVANPIRDASDPITRFIGTHFSLERGSTVGFMLTSFGVLFGILLVVDWAQTGYETVPKITDTILAGTLVLVGFQVVFTSFFLEIIENNQ